MLNKKLLYILSPNRFLRVKEFIALERIFREFSAYLYAFQLRIKDRESLMKAIPTFLVLCKEYMIPLVINDFPDLVTEFNADGVHIGESDSIFEDCRSLLPKEKIIGVSCYADVGKAEMYKSASYVSFGCFFESATKPNPVARATVTVLEEWKSLGYQTPCVCIGGINNDNFMSLIHAGADIVAISGYLWESASPYERFIELIRELQ
ncbi:thiamine monophosphate synthase/TENI family protein [Neorickettsia helminthoeca str. Oregon]|uniref:Thiamine monophosphate synthase/TENI family protein n=1 Tax=Neorickettsia helminthoeca str. Oregon TaxID=1286528 RepID=X5GVS1_9RICK|nr:thiamine phosphate synthase [Neorickettsia helminthoeca]AHX11167.1 thiamine monophosphate synthase/TENI family protein [Neorickettsia helminthoeca str. Oregon]